MNKVEHLLVCLAEECSEVAQAATKALRFGLNDKGPNHELTNAEYIAREFNDVIAVVKMLEELGLIPLCHSPISQKAKKDRVILYMEYAKRCGTLEVENPQQEEAR
jgi:hypothetical protein